MYVKLVFYLGEHQNKIKPKSSILFGKNVNIPLRQDIKTALGIFNEGGMGLYLELP